jgi:hypothetical protein
LVSDKFGLFGEEKKEHPCEEMWFDRSQLNLKIF